MQICDWPLLPRMPAGQVLTLLEGRPIIECVALLPMASTLSHMSCADHKRRGLAVSRYGMTLEAVRAEMEGGTWLCPHCYEDDHPNEVQIQSNIRTPHQAQPCMNRGCLHAHYANQ